MAEENISIVSRTVAVTGHRTVENLNTARLEEVFRLLIKKGYDTYLVGMAVGFDTICFNILEKLREEYDIKIVACIPCKDTIATEENGEIVKCERQNKYLVQTPQGFLLKDKSC